MAMDAKDLRIESALGARGDDATTKFAQSGTALQSNSSKSYHDIGSNPLAKVDVPTARPCAIIGPDRVVPPQSMNPAFHKKVPVDPWPYAENIYQHPPEYPHKPTEYQPSRNISPRQTFQENMQRIMVPPSYASVKHAEDNCLKNPKFSDVPYNISTISNDPKSVKSSEGLLPSNSPNQPVIPNGWASGGVNVRPLRPYGAPELYQYSDYSNYPGPRPISMIRPHRNIHEDGPPAFQDRLYNEGNIRFKPYPTAKERPLHHPQARYEYIPSYPSVFHPHAPYPPQKYDLQKSIPTHAYSMFPPVPLKYLDRRMPAPPVEKFSRSPTQQVNFNSPFCNQNIPSTYGSVPGNCMQNRGYPYAPDPPTKHMIQNKIFYDANKYYTSSENIFMNDNINRANLKNDVLYPSYPPHINIHSVPPHHMYRKENSIKGYDQAVHYRNFEYSTNINPLGRIPLQFLPQTMSMSSDSNTSNDTTHIVGNTHDDFGYVSQSSTASIKSIESGITRVSSNLYRRNDVRHELNSHMNKCGQKLDNNAISKDKKDLDVRQFLQMWNEGEDEGNDNKAKQRDSNNTSGHYESDNTQEQLYVLDLVNVPNEELAKYDHIQKISKLPENIKGYNSIELLNQYEKLVESQGLRHFAVSPSQSKQKDLHVPLRNGLLGHGADVVSANIRPLSPLDVEAKISQSIIHKEVGCNFEIRPCSPQMMNVEIATPVHNVLNERLIEKVVNSVNTKSPLHHRIEESNNHSSSRNSPKITSCKMASNQYPSPNVNDSLKTNYCLQDLESNSGVCLASLPRLDNEIELNFPEINQQFINANKISAIQDLPILDTVIGATTNKSKSKHHNQPFIPENLHSGSESDKEVSKLSKYRKHKRNSIPSENSEHISHPRTDSVIIKNPENIRSQENINNIHLFDKNTSVKENLVKPLNDSTESDRALNNSDEMFTKTIYENITDYNSIDVNDAAIDFSINKSDYERNNSINNRNNISDAAQNNTEIVKNGHITSETIHCSIDKGEENISKRLQEISGSDDFSVLQPKSPELGNFTCSNMHQNVDLISSNEAHETVITSLESDTKVSNTLSTENIAPQNHLPCVNGDTENLSKNVTTIKSVTHSPTKINSASFADMNEETRNCDLLENTVDVTPICEPEYNFIQKNQTTHTDETVINDDGHSKSYQKELILSEGVAGGRNAHLVANIEENYDDDNLGIKENDCEEIKTVNLAADTEKMDDDGNLGIQDNHYEKFKTMNLVADIERIGDDEDLGSQENEYDNNKTVDLVADTEKMDECEGVGIQESEYENNKTVNLAADTEKMDDDGNLGIQDNHYEKFKTMNLVADIERIGDDEDLGSQENEYDNNKTVDLVADTEKMDDYEGVGIQENEYENNKTVNLVADTEKMDDNEGLGIQENDYEKLKTMNLVTDIEKIGDDEGLRIQKNEYDNNKTKGLVADTEKMDDNEGLGIQENDYEKFKTMNLVADIEKIGDDEGLGIQKNEYDNNKTEGLVADTEIMDDNEGLGIQENDYEKIKIVDLVADTEKTDDGESSGIQKNYNVNSKTVNLAADTEKMHDDGNLRIPENEYENNINLNLVADIEEMDDDENLGIQENDYEIFKNMNLVADTDKLDDKDLGIKENEYEKIQTATMESEISLQMTVENLKFETEILKSKPERKRKEKTIDVIEFEADKNIDFTYDCVTENHVRNEDIVELDYIKPDKSDSLRSNYISNSDSIQIERKKVDVFENNKIISEITATNIIIDINETLPLQYKDPTTERNQVTKRSLQVNVRKEMFSSSFQNLWIYNEGFCGSLESFKLQSMDCLYPELQDKNSKSKKIIEENTVCIESKNSSDGIVVRDKNEGTIVEVEFRNPAALADITKTPITDLDEKPHCEAISNIVKYRTHSQTVSNQISENLHEVASVKNNINKDDDKLPENILDVNTKSYHKLKENMSIADNLICNQLPNRRYRTLKRSLSDSAVNGYNALGEDMQGKYDNNFMHGVKRPKIPDTEILVEEQIITENFASFIQSNRRNSISTLYNEDNVSFCIVIDNDCVLTDGNESCEKICYTELSDDECLTAICTEGEPINPELNKDISFANTPPISIEGEFINSDITEYFPYENDISIAANSGILNTELDSEKVPNHKRKHCVQELNSLILQDMEGKTVDESWVEDVACIETVFSDDVAEDVVISAPSSPKDTDSSDEESDITNFMFNVGENEHTDRVKYIYGSQMCDNDALLVEKLYRTPQMDVNKTLVDRDSQFLHGYNRYYDNESLEKVLSECNTLDTCISAQNASVSDKSVVLAHNIKCVDFHGNKENFKELLSEQESKDGKYKITDLSSIQTKVYEEKKTETYDDCNLHSCKSSCDNFESYKKEENLQYAISSSPEVSSTTPEEKSPGILLTIRSYKGTKISEVNEMRPSFKHAHSQIFNNNSLSMSRPLITKAAQKYIPPLKETIRDLKVKIRLPKQSLYKLQQLKKSKEQPKIDTNRGNHYIRSLTQECPKKAKPKPKFEDVLMSIDEIQFKKHKEKNKKTKQSVPKVIIKKNENGAHYTSTETKETYNPDLTGRKWQPWVFLEKSSFVDKMALKKKFKAIYSHRKKTFVLAENFQKYKSFSNPKFVISHPKCNDNISTGKLKYTIRLKHS